MQPHSPSGQDSAAAGRFAFNRILTGDARVRLAQLPEASVDLSFWSPPYHVGKSYERHLSFDDWRELLRDVIRCHRRIVKPGGFLVVNIGDILCFPDPAMPKFQANNVRRKTQSVTTEQVLAARKAHPRAKRQELAALLGCSEQTIQRRLEHNNVRGGKQSTPTKVLLTGCLVSEWAEDAGFFLYDQRIWHKDPCWANSRWHSNSYRAVDEFEHIYVFLATRHNAIRPGAADTPRVGGLGLPRRLAHPFGEPQPPPRGGVPGRTRRPRDPPLLAIWRGGAGPVRRHRHHHQSGEIAGPAMARH